MNTIANLRSFENLYLSNDGKIDAKEAKLLVKIAGDDAGNQAALREMFARDAFDSGVDPNKLLKGAKIAKVSTSPIAGKTVGNTTVIRSFGAPEGYSNKFQAIGVARMQGTAPLAVVKDSSGKWHAVQTKEALTSTKIDKAFPLKDVDEAAHKAALKMPSGTTDEKIAQAKALAMASYGVPADLLNVGEGKGKFDPEKINVDVANTGGSGKTHVHSKTCGCTGTTIEVTLARLKNRPESSTATLYHEGQHKADHDAQDGKLDGGNKKLNAMEKLSKDTLPSSGGSHETSAYGRTFMVTIDKDKSAALDQLLSFMDTEDKVSNSKLHEGMVKEMKAHFKTLPYDKQQDFKQVVAVGQLYWPKSTLWKDLFGDEKKPAVTKETVPINW